MYNEYNQGKTLIVLLLALSTFRKLEKNQEKFGKCTWDYNGYRGEYYYQLEPIPMLLKEMGSRPDCFIVLGTNVTGVEKPYPYDDKDDKSEDFLISEEKFFESKVMENEWINPQTGKYYLIQTENFDDGIADNLLDNTVYKTINKIRELNKEYNLEIYVDEHGGNRDNQRAITAVTSLLDGEISPEGYSISIKKIFTVGLEKDGIYPIFESGYSVVEFVSGITEFINYGRIDSLKKYYGEREIVSSLVGFGSKSEELTLIDHLKLISDGIQLCDLSIFEKGLKNLKEYYGATSETPISNTYLSLFRDTIYNEYGSIISADDELVKMYEELKLCHRKGYYQQALTIIEGRTPDVLNRKSIFSYPEEVGQYATNKNAAYYPSVLLFNDLVINNLKKDVAVQDFRYDDCNFVDADFISAAAPTVIEKYILTESGNEYTKVKDVGGIEYTVTFTKNLKAFLQLFRCLKSRRNASNHVSGESVGNPENEIECLNDRIDEYLKDIEKIIDYPDRYRIRIDADTEKIHAISEVKLIKDYYSGARTFTIGSKYRNFDNKYNSLITSLQAIDSYSASTDDQIFTFINRTENICFKAVLSKKISMRESVNRHSLIANARRGSNDLCNWLFSNYKTAANVILSVV